MSILTPAPSALCEVGAPPTSPPLPVALPVSGASAEVCRGAGWSQHHPAAPATESQRKRNCVFIQQQHYRIHVEGLIGSDERPFGPFVPEHRDYTKNVEKL